MTTGPRAPRRPKHCIGPCKRELAKSNQGTLDDGDDAPSETRPAPHHHYYMACIDCIADGYTPPAVTPAGKCVNCERESYQATDVELLPVPEGTLLAGHKNPTVCVHCLSRGFVPPKTSKRRDVVIENCKWYLENGIGLSEAAEREGYGDRSHLDSVLRRWGQIELTHQLGALDPGQPRERL